MVNHHQIKTNIALSALILLGCAPPSAHKNDQITYPHNASMEKFHIFHNNKFCCDCSSSESHYRILNIIKQERPDYLKWVTNKFQFGDPFLDKGKSKWTVKELRLKFSVVNDHFKFCENSNCFKMKMEYNQFWHSAHFSLAKTDLDGDQIWEKNLGKRCFRQPVYPFLTTSGLIFITLVQDVPKGSLYTVQSRNPDNGKLLWEFELPYHDTRTFSPHDPLEFWPFYRDGFIFIWSQSQSNESAGWTSESTELFVIDLNP